MARMLLLGSLAAGVASVQAEETHPFSVHDMLAMDRISDPQASPDGRQVVFVVRKTDLEANRGRTDLWLVPTDGSSKPIRLTSDPANDHNPRWSADGRHVYFLSSRSDSSQVWKIHVAGGEARQVTELPLDVEALALSPDGKSMAVGLSVFPDASPSETKKRLDEIAEDKATGRVYDRLFVRHWDTWKDGRRSHVFVLPIDGSGDPVDVMKGMDADCPAKPFGGPGDFTFTPDGRSVVFAARDAGREEAWSTNFDLFVAPIDGSAGPRNLTEENKAWDTRPVFSPDGRTLAYLAMRRPGYESDAFRLHLMRWPDGPTRAISSYHSPGSITWSADSGTIHTTGDFRGQRRLFSVEVAGWQDRAEAEGLVSQSPVQEGTVGGVAAAADGTIVFGLDHLQSPVELYTIRPDGTERKQITDLNGTKLAQARMGDFEQFSFKGWNDEVVFGYVVKPVDFDASKTYPVAFLIHGGPQGSFGNHFHYRWNPQAYAGAGYAAVMVDFHGSTGYGQAFTDSIRGDWGGKPLVDLQKGLAAALEQYPWMDGDRVSALGASFGGYMINWIAGNWPDRFRSLVNHDGNLCERMAYYDTEELWFPEWDHMGTPSDNPKGYEKHNPINHVGQWKTPMLVIHGALDYRVVDTQGIATFTALQRRGIPSKFLYFPDENHWVLKPANSILWHDTVISWLDQWTK